MIFIDITASEWSKKHKIEIIKETCKHCKEEFNLDVPVATKDSRGFLMKDHGCSLKNRPYTFVPIKQDIQSKIDQIVGRGIRPNKDD